MSPSLRPNVASPRSSVNDFFTSPASSSSESFGPVPVPRAVKVAVLLRFADAPSTRVPQCGQNGSAESTAFPQLAQAFTMPSFGAAADETRVSGIPFEARTGSEPAGRSTYAPDGLSTAGTEMTRAPPLTTGLPQSMQNLDCSSFSRPQKPQRFTRSSPIASRDAAPDRHFVLSGANIDRGSGSGQSNATTIVFAYASGTTSPSCRARSSGRLFAGAGARARSS